MKNVFLLYLLFISTSLVFLSAYFSIAFFDYIESVFSIVSMILLLSVFFMLFLSNKDFFSESKLLFMSFFFLIMNLSLGLMRNLFLLSSEALIIIGIFEQFSFIAFACLFCIFTYSLSRKPSLKSFILLFSPLIIYSLLLVFIRSFGIVQEYSLINYFLISFTALYSFLSGYNFIKAYKGCAELLAKSTLIIAGFLLILIFIGFKQAGMFFFLNSIIISAGSFAVCLGVLMGNDLGLYEGIFNRLLSILPNDSKGKYLSWLLRVSSKMDGLKVIAIKSKIKLVDNPNISNKKEMGMYDELLIFSLNWLGRNAKVSKTEVSNIKKYYNSQKIMTRRLGQFSL